MFTRQSATRFLKRFLQLKSISLNGKIKVSDRKSTGEIADGSPGEKDGHAGIASGIANEPKGVLLGGGKAIFEKVVIVGHDTGAIALVRLRSCPLLPGNPFVNLYSTVTYGTEELLSKVTM